MAMHMTIIETSDTIYLVPKRLLILTNDHVLKAAAIGKVSAFVIMERDGRISDSPKMNSKFAMKSHEAG